VAPRQLCNNLLHKLLIRPSIGKGPHILEIPRTETLDAGKLGSQVPSQLVNDFRSPASRLLPHKDSYHSLLADRTEKLAAVGHP